MRTRTGPRQEIFGPAGESPIETWKFLTFSAFTVVD